MNKGYKVLSIRDYGLISVSSPDPVVYEEGQVTKPKPEFGPLAVFSSYEAAHDFVRNYCYVADYNMAIYECEFVPVEDSKMELWIMYFYFDPFHYGVRYERKIVEDRLPPDTILASEVTITNLIKEIYI